ncbi:mariner Mos1 transposase [Trichonephila clavipes]|nr:mariner Mos1 transposase [Trichonephila clavipes]
MKKSAAEAHRMLSNTYGEAAISGRTCREWFQRFQNGDFEVEDQHGGGREKVFEDAELEALLDQDSCQTQQELSRSFGGHFKTPESHGNDSETRKLGAVRVEAERC